MNLTPRSSAATTYVLRTSTWAIAGVLFVARLAARCAGAFGRALRAIRDAEIAAVSSGVNLAALQDARVRHLRRVRRHRRLALAIAIAYVNPDTFPIDALDPAAHRRRRRRARLAGRRVFGALFVEFVRIYAPSILDGVQKVIPTHLDPKAAGAPAVVYGVVLMLVLFVLPGGVADLLRQLLRPLRARRRDADPVAPAPGEAAG